MFARKVYSAIFLSRRSWRHFTRQYFPNIQRGIKWDRYKQRKVMLLNIIIREKRVQCTVYYIMMKVIMSCKRIAYWRDNFREETELSKEIAPWWKRANFINSFWKGGFVLLTPLPTHTQCTHSPYPVHPGCNNTA